MTTRSRTSETATRYLVTEPHFDAPDEFYQILIEAHQGLSEEKSQQLNALLVLLLANHVGEMLVLRETVAVARASLLRA